jgi:HD-GYP domain-containing protein (c-di-GMP phosphodiesterase class II)
MAIADIYEALTAADRPYKDGKKLSMAMRIMGFMKNDYHIDKDLFEIFVKEGVYKNYAKEYVDKNQIDEVDQEAILS